MDDMEYFDNKALYQFTIPTKSKAQRASIYNSFTNIKSCCFTHMMWDICHFSGVEYAQKKKVYTKDKTKKQNQLCQKET